MNKFIILLISFLICFTGRITDNITYNYSDKNILDKDVSWIKEIRKEEDKEIEEDKIKIEEVAVEQQDILDVFYGRMSGYGPDCVGCSGYLAYRGLDVRFGNIYFDDSEYGRVRIVAGDRSIPFGSIIEVNDSLQAIVLDRGGAIGFGKSFLFDLLQVSEAVANEKGILVNAKFEVLRYGF